MESTAAAKPHDDIVLGNTLLLRSRNCYEQRERKGAMIRVLPSIRALSLLTSATMVSLALLSSAVLAQGPPQTIQIAKVDVQTLAAGYRASKVIGSTLVNDGNESIGKIDDIIVSPDGKAPFAVLSIGGFLGMGTHLVVVPYDSLKLGDNKVVLPGGTKDALRALPEFKYATH